MAFWYQRNSYSFDHSPVEYQDRQNIKGREHRPDGRKFASELAQPEAHGTAAAFFEVSGHYPSFSSAGRAGLEKHANRTIQQSLDSYRKERIC